MDTPGYKMHNPVASRAALFPEEGKFYFLAKSSHSEELAPPFRTLRG
jgi:hypothetical protein